MISKVNQNQPQDNFLPIIRDLSSKEETTVILLDNPLYQHEPLHVPEIYNEKPIPAKLIIPNSHDSCLDEFELILAENEEQNINENLIYINKALNDSESQLSAEKINLGLSTTSALISAIKLPLNYLPARFLPYQAFIETGKLFLIGISWAINFANIVITGLDLYQKNKDVGTLHQWIVGHRTWKKKHRPTFEAQAEINRTANDVHIGDLKRANPLKLLLLPP